jgi:hypothetical protein
MKINAKIAALAGAALLMGSVAFAANSYDGATDDYELPQGFTFYNEVSSDVVEAEGSFYNKTQNGGFNGADPHKNYQVEFAGISEKVGISYDSEKFWFELAPKFSLKDNNEHWNVNNTKWTTTNQALNNDDLSFAWTDLDWGVRFTPFDIVDFYLHHDVWTAGSYLPIADQHVGGNLAGAGFAVVFKPIDGLRIGLSVPFSADIISAPNFLNAELEDKDKGTALVTAKDKESDYRFRFDAGVDYKLLDMITIGAFVGNIINRDARSYGLYANAGISFLDFNVGYTYNGDATRVSALNFADTSRIFIGGHHKANLSVAASFGDFTAQLEALMNFFKGQSLYDLYAGIKVGYDLLPGKFNLALRSGVAYDMGNKSATNYGSYLRYEEQGAHDGKIVTSECKGFRSKKGAYKNYQKGTGTVNVNAAPVVFLSPSITYTTGRNTFAATANLQYWLDGEGSYAANLPVSWKYTF